MRQLFLLSLASFCFLNPLLSSTAVAHPAIEAQVAIVNEQIEREPANASLYVKRGQLRFQHREWQLALEDFAHALRLDPDLRVAYLRQGETLLAGKRFKEAKQMLDQFLETDPNQPDGLVLRARASRQLGDARAAVADYGVAINSSARPQPDWYLERARTLAADGNFDEAINSLDEGITRLGTLVTLHSLAIELELHQKRYDDALARVDRLLATMQRHEQWLIRRGEILAESGRTSEARDAYSAALKAIDTLSLNRRQSKAVIELENFARERLAKLSPRVITPF